MGRSLSVGVVFALGAGLLVAAAPSSATGMTGEPSAAATSVAAAMRSSKGRVIVRMKGSGTFTLRGKKLRKSASISKAFKVKAGKYTVKAPGGRVKPGTFRVRPGKTVRVKVTFPTSTVTPTPPTSPTPTPTPTSPPQVVGPVQEWVDPGTTVTVSAGGGYAITVPAGALATRSLVSVTPLPAVDGVLPSANFHIDGTWTGSVTVRLPAPSDMAGSDQMVLHDAADGLRVSSGQFVSPGTADGLPTVTAQVTSLSQLTAAGIQCPADDQPLLRALVVGCSDRKDASVMDVWKSVAKQKWDQALALEQADAACGQAVGNVAEVGAIINAKMSCSLSAIGSEGKFRFANTSDESVLGWGLPVVLGHADKGATITSSKDNTKVQWLLTPLSELGEPQFLYPGAELTLTKPENVAESDITWKVDRNATVAAVYLQWVTAQIGAKALDKGALKTAVATKLLSCGRKGSQETAASCATDAVIDGAKTLLPAVAGLGLSKLLSAMDAGIALGTALDGLDPRTTTTHLINSTPADPPSNRGGSSWIARNPDNGRAVLVDGATVRPITDGATFNCLATTRVVWDIPTLRALRTATPQPAVCDNSGRAAWDVRPAPTGNVGTGIILRDTSTTPHTNYLVNAAGQLQTIPDNITYRCLSESDPTVWNASGDSVRNWAPRSNKAATCDDTSALPRIGQAATLPADAQINWYNTIASPSGGFIANWSARSTPSRVYIGLATKSGQPIGTAIELPIADLIGVTAASDGTAYFTTGSLNENEGGELLAWTPGDNEAARVYSFGMAPLYGAMRTPQTPVYIDGSIVVEALAHNAYNSCQSKLYKISPTGRTIATAPGTSCGGSWDAAAGRIQVADYGRGQVSWLNPADLTTQATGQMGPYPTDRVYHFVTFGADGSITQPYGEPACGQTGIKHWKPNGDVAWDKQLNEVLGLDAEQACSLLDLATATDGSAVVVARNWYGLVSAWIAPDGSVTRRVVDPSENVYAALATADGSGHVVIAYGKPATCQDPNGNSYVCAVLSSGVSSRTSWQPIQNRGGEYDNSWKLWGPLLVADGGYVTRGERAPFFCGVWCWLDGSDPISTVSVDAAVSRQTWHNPA